MRAAWRHGQLNGPRKLRKERDWYKVSVDTLRGWGIFVALVAVAGAGYLGYRVWERYAIQRREDPRTLLAGDAE